jgi:hypothetical protein
VVEDRFYNHAGYRTLTTDQKNELRLKRKHRGGYDNGRNKGIIEEAMARASVKRNGRKTRRPSSL